MGLSYGGNMPLVCIDYMFNDHLARIELLLFPGGSFRSPSFRRKRKLPTANEQECKQQFPVWCCKAKVRLHLPVVSDYFFWSEANLYINSNAQTNF
jgi:hypothetical protein